MRTQIIIKRKLNLKKRGFSKYHGSVTCIKYCDVGAPPDVRPQPVAVASIPVYVEESVGMQTGKT